jgi:hypothetical protein
MRRSILFVLLCLSFLAAAAPEPAGATDPACITDSTETTDLSGNQVITLISSAPCGFFHRANTRFARISNVETQITVGYMTNEPSPYKAIAVLFAGSDGVTGITPDPCFNGSPPCDPAPVATAGNNFLVRTAQLFAEAGFKAITIGRPTDAPPDGTPCGGTVECYSLYRLTQRHAVDIASVVKQENPLNKHVFLVGTSRGALSAIAQNLIGVGSMISSPVTLAAITSTTAGIPSPCDANHTPFVGDCFYVELQPASVDVPVQIIAHAQDTCFVSPPSQAATVATDFTSAGVTTFSSQVTGGFELIGGDPCEAQSHHGYLGIETKTVQRITKRMTAIRKAINQLSPGDHPPVANDGSFSAVSPSPAPPMFDLATLATDPDPATTFTFNLVHSESARGVPLSLSGSTVIYDIASAGLTGPTVNDAFVYTVDDGFKKRFGIVRVTVTLP